VKIRHSARVAALAVATVGGLIMPMGLTSAQASPEEHPTVSVSASDIASGIDALAASPELSPSELGALLDENRAVLEPTSGLATDLTHARGWDLGGGQVIVRVPFAAGPEVRDESAVTAQLSPGADPVVMEVVMTAQSEASGHVETWVNGAKTVDQVVSDTTAPVKQTKGAKWDRFVQCLNNAGVPSWVVAGLSLACAAVCAVTLGAGCAVCLGAAAAGFSGTISFCIAWANG